MERSQKTPDMENKRKSVNGIRYLFETPRNYLDYKEEEKKNVEHKMIICKREEKNGREQERKSRFASFLTCYYGIIKKGMKNQKKKRTNAIHTR